MLPLVALLQYSSLPRKHHVDSRGNYHEMPHVYYAIWCCRRSIGIIMSLPFSIS